MSSTETARAPITLSGRDRQVSTTLKRKSAEDAAAEREMQKRARKYDRSAPVSTKSVTDKKLRSTLARQEARIEQSKMAAVRSEVLLTEQAGSLEAEGMEKTYHFKQSEIKEHIGVASAAKSFELSLDTFGPYKMRYTRNGKHAIVAGRKGHVATFDWGSGKLGCELHLKETVRDALWLHNESLFAVAQRKYVYIYDSKGIEIHCMRKHIEPNALDFLPFHFLLVSIGASGYLKYQDTSTGGLVAEHRTRKGASSILTHNPHNAVSTVGHHNGTVTMWTPNMSAPVVSMLAHTGPLCALTYDHQGNYMVSSGVDNKMKVWDIRTYKTVHTYHTLTPATTLAVSQRGLLAVGNGPHVTVWQDALRVKQESPYLSSLFGGESVESLRFCPFEDVLGVGRSRGVTSLLVPGAGEPNFDAFEANPFERKKQRQEREVKQLLTKIQPSMITLDAKASIARVASKRGNGGGGGEDDEEDGGASSSVPHGVRIKKEKKKARGRSSALRRAKRKQAVVVTRERQLMLDKLEHERAKAQQEREKALQKKKNKGKAPAGSSVTDHDDETPSALSRFTSTKR